MRGAVGGAEAFGDERVATAEAYVPSVKTGVATVGESAALFWRLNSTLAVALDAARGLGSPPAWVHWDHDQTGLWPLPDDRESDLDAHRVDWIDSIAADVRPRLTGANEPVLVGHADWVEHNVWWNCDGSPRAVHDWDSLTALPEPALVGVAAAIYAENPTLEQSACFLAAYEEQRRRRGSRDSTAWRGAPACGCAASTPKKTSLPGAKRHSPLTML